MSDSPSGYFVNGNLTKLGLTSLPELSLHFLTSCFVFFRFFFKLPLCQASGSLGSFKNSLFKSKGFCSFYKEQDLCSLYKNGSWGRLDHVAKCGEMLKNLGPRPTRLSQKFVANVAQRESRFDCWLPSFAVLWA